MVRESGTGFQDAAPARPFSLAPIMFLAFSGSMTMMAFVALVGPVARIAGLAPWQVGIAVTAAGIAWMVSARAWGVASDRRGRRPVLLAGIAGFAVSFGALCMVMSWAATGMADAALVFAGLVIGRTMAGAFYAAVPPVCAALIADQTPPGQRAGAMASVGAANAVGMVIGPGGAGLIAAWSLSLSLQLMMLFPVAALIVAWLALPRDQPRASSGKPRLRLADRRIRRAVVTAFVAMSSVAVAQLMVGFYAIDRLGLPPAEAARSAGIALALVGGALFVSQVALRRIGWPPTRFIRVGGVVAALGFGSVALVDGVAGLWACYVVAALGMGWVYPSISALAANSVDAHEQGAAAGVVGAAQGLGAATAPILGTGIYALSYGAPYVLVAVALMAVAIWPAAEGAKGEAATAGTGRTPA